MNLDKLEVGQLYKNYRQLCKALGEEVKNGGTSRTSQIAEWERHFEFQREKNAYIITYIYDEPLTKERKYADRLQYSRYVKHIANLILLTAYDPIYSKTPTSFMDRNQYYALEITKSTLFEFCGLWTQTYKHHRKEYYRGLEQGNQKDFDKEEFFSLVYRTAYQTTQDALESLSKHGVITVQPFVTLVDNTTKEHRYATKEEEIYVEDAEAYARRKLGAATEFQVSIKNQWKKYQSYISEYLIEKYGWASAYKQYRIIVLDSDKTNELLQEFEQELISEQLIEDRVSNERVVVNRKYTDTLKERIQTLFENTFKEVKGFKEEISKSRKYRRNVLTPEFVTNSIELVNNIIVIDKSKDAIGLNTGIVNRVLIDAYGGGSRKIKDIAIKGKDIDKLS